MNIRKYINTSLALAAVLLAACSPDEYSLSTPDFKSEDLVQGTAYTVTVDEKNTVTLKSLLPDKYHCYWTQPNGRSQGKEVTLQLPFAGTYEVTFGVDTPGGVVYGAPYQFQITTNNMLLLDDVLFTYLTGGVGKSKKWVPVDRNYGVGQCTGPVMYCNPDDVLNDGSGSTDLCLNHMVPNWDPGFQSWLIPEDSPYMDSYMVFSLDDKNGCSITEYRGETGTKGASEGTTKTGKWNLKIADKTHPTLSFTDTYSMHNVGFDEVCSNYTSDIIITELTPYILQLATMRTNSEGPWWLIWNFVAEDVQNGTVIIPSEDPEYIEPSAPVLPEIGDLEEKLFTTDINGVTFRGDAMTFNISEDAPYEYMWWNGGTKAWETVINGSYGKAWWPVWSEDALENELTLTKKSDGSYTFDCGGVSGNATIADGRITFEQEVTFFTVTGDQRIIELKGTDWQIFKCDPGSELILGIPNDSDIDGNITTYLVVNLTYKPVGGGATGPTVVPFDNSKVNNYIEAEKYFRCQLYNPWGGSEHAIDPANIKIKKNQKLNVTLSLHGFTFSQPAKMVLCCNRGAEQDWEDNCFNYSRAIEVNGDGTYTISWTNDTGSTVKWDDGLSALTMTMQYVGYAEVAPDAEGSYKAACSIESITIE